MTDENLELSRRLSLPGEINREYLLAMEAEDRERNKEQMASQKCAEEILVSL